MDKNLVIAIILESKGFSFIKFLRVIISYYKSKEMHKQDSNTTSSLSLSLLPFPIPSPAPSNVSAISLTEGGSVHIFFHVHYVYRCKIPQYCSK